jgi:6-phosphofructokinase 2
MAGERIVTLTLNPALDVSLLVDHVVPTHKLRTNRPRYQPGGGGINVSRVCNRLGESTTAVVPLGGPPGLRMSELLLDELDEAELRIVPIANDTRESLSVRSRSTGEQYRFVLPGPEMTSAELEACLDAVVAAAAGCRTIVMSGSLPPGVDPGFVADLVNRLPESSVVIDTSGPALVAALASNAYLVKPSARELASIAHRELDTEADIIEAAIEVKAQSSVNVLVVSIGPGGAVVVTDDGPFRLRAPAVKVHSAVGAGDSMVAGIATGLQRNLHLLDAVGLGVAAGTAAVLTDGSDLCARVDVDRLLPLVGPGEPIAFPVDAAGR